MQVVHIDSFFLCVSAATFQKKYIGYYLKCLLAIFKENM